MNRWVRLAAFLAAAARAWAQDAAPSPAASPSVDPEYELVVGGVEVQIALDGAAEIKSPSGETLSVRLQRRKERTWRSDGITFQFPGEMSAKHEAEGDLVTITLDHPASPHAIVQLFPPEVVPTEVPKTLMTGLEQEFSGKAAKQSKRPESKKRAFGDQQRDGVTMQYQLAGETIVVECYAWKSADRTIAVTLQYATEDAELADKAFSVLTASLR
jgi:hypothetical protein